MHGGSIDNPESGAGRVYSVLLERDGAWVGGWELTQAAEVSAVSTRVSEVRHALESMPARGERVESKQQGRKWFYRLVRVPGGQLELVV